MKTQATFTPWTLDDAREDPFRRGMYVQDAKGVDVARVYRPEMGLLLAAAPELLEIAQALHDRMAPEYHEDGRVGDFKSDIRDLIPTLRAAILKATGEAS